MFSKNQTLRQIFLNQFWRQYPEHEPLASHFQGRVLARTQSGLWLQDKPFQFNELSWRTKGLIAKAPSTLSEVPGLESVLDVGDWIGVSRQGEVTLFAPCNLEESNIERDEALIRAHELQTQAVEWSEFLKNIRHFFVKRGFLEMTTPTVAPSPGTEPYLDPIALKVKWDGREFERYLITSPEFHLKQALAAGVSKIFEIAKCFRDQEGGPCHQFEFHMLEWYRSFSSLDPIAQDTEELIATFAPDVKIVRTSMAELFRIYLGFELTANTSRDELFKAAENSSVHTHESDDFNDVFHRLFLQKIEPELSTFSKDQPVLIGGFPPSMAALARVDSAGFADRFEVYWRGLELCNAFHELNDPLENRARFDADNRLKILLGRSPVALDQGLLRSLDMGMPPSGGIALGLERLFMALKKKSSIDEVRPFTRYI